jgi:hypothetical protein
MEYPFNGKRGREIVEGKEEETMKEKEREGKRERKGESGGKGGRGNEKEGEGGREAQNDILKRIIYKYIRLSLIKKIYN